MLDSYRDKQSLFCEEIKKSIDNKKISHAYLIETNNYIESNDLVIAFIKELFKIYFTSTELDNIYNLIDNNAFSDFIIIEPDGSWIKKEQILELKEKFMTKSFNNNPRIYLIKDADKLNKFAANSLLKFLEEPEGNIIAVLMTENRYKVLETIRSRCLLYTLLNNDRKLEIDNSDEVVKIIEVFETKGTKAIAYLPICLENDLRNKEYWVNTFKSMINMYDSCIRKIEELDFYDYGDILALIIENNSLEKIVNKISILFTYINSLDYNLNVNMMLDRFIIDFSGSD